MTERRPPFSVHSRLRSFAFAFAGLRYFVAREHNAWLHALATVAVVALGAWVGVSREDWLRLVLAIGWVWMAEAFNTALERLADAVTTERSPAIKVVKDLAAAGVLIAAVGAALIGLIVFYPHLKIGG